eukprot:CAMPEP_0113312194 /NCGR_PEP_ID=MMETSP0010_2-20120614/9120_1 /TAXON_ID=216773 ORGANISM="Corethron hystrix, Strain 308" /NCGR_SAMPLE_ID=MMETSP0010_2 /ASSEMBLY_ACC=CAM_ASM_000155 /LENGTH=723 /DNA_ID=CAMNT_0000167967 /DNA_START=180 /DNA_END=2347 /DNA_ORIENTATION=+ /assembly_acc=CAM_ASM_000155
MTNDMNKLPHSSYIREAPEVALRRRLEEEKLRRRMKTLVAAAEKPKGKESGNQPTSSFHSGKIEEKKSKHERASDSSSSIVADNSKKEVNQPQHFLLNSNPLEEQLKMNFAASTHNNLLNRVMSMSRESESMPKLFQHGPVSTLQHVAENNQFPLPSIPQNSVNVSLRRGQEKTDLNVSASSQPQLETQTPPGLPKSSSSTSNKKSIKSNDRKKLRKGKWTAEEEEFTSRIIHYFSTGLLTLPEGTTLRSYLSETLSCDPMRITKKFAGASCLGKRVYRLCDRSKATANDNEMAKKELAHLEQRFRAKVQQGQAPFFGQDIAENVSTPVNSGAIPQVSLPNLSQYGSQTNSAVTSFPWLFPPVTPQWFNGMGSNTLNMNVPILPNTLNPSINSALPGQLQNNVSPGVSPGNTLPTNPLSSLNWIQALAAMIPQTNHTVTPAFNTIPSRMPPVNAAATATAIDHTQELWKNQQNALAAAKAAEAKACQADSVKDAKLPQKEAAVPQTPLQDTATKNTPVVRSKEEEDAGTMLLGFLSTLRRGHNAAIEELKKQDNSQNQTKQDDICTQSCSASNSPPCYGDYASCPKGSTDSKISERSGTIPSPAEDEQTKESSMGSSTSNGTTHPSESSGGNSYDSEISETLSSSDNHNQDRDSTQEDMLSGDDSDKEQGYVGTLSSKNVADHTTRMYALEKSPSALESLTCHSRLPNRKRKLKAGTDKSLSA